MSFFVEQFLYMFLAFANLFQYTEENKPDKIPFAFKLMWITQRIGLSCGFVQSMEYWSLVFDPKLDRSTLDWFVKIGSHGGTCTVT